MRVLLNTLDKVEKFYNTILEHDIEVHVIQNGWEFSYCSIMVLLSMNLLEPIGIEFIGSQEEELKLIKELKELGINNIDEN